MAIRITTSGSVRAHGLLYIRSIHCYHIVLPVEQQFRNFTYLELGKLSKLYFLVSHLSYKLSSAVTDSPVVCIQEPAIWDRGPVFKGPILGRATFGPCTLSNPYPQLHTGSLAKHHIFCEYGICGA